MEKSRLLRSKLFGILAIAMLSAMLITACGKDDADKEAISVAGESEAGDFDKENSQATDKQSNSSDAEEEVDAPQITLDDVAKMNGMKVDELNVVYDEEGYVSFLGHKFSDTKINDENDALDALYEVADLAGINYCNLDFYRKDDSTKTGLSYYTFYQTDLAVIDGQEYPAKFYGNLIKLIADKNGNVAGFSAFVNHEGTYLYDEDAFLSAEDAEWIVDQIIEGQNYIYSDYTSFFYWDDIGTVSDGAKVVPVWGVYIENPENTRKPYLLVLINALTEAYEEAETYMDSVVTSIETGSLGELDNYDGMYTSELFFAGMEDAGEYTYTIDMTWAKSLNQGYKAGDSISVTVPVMYDPVDKLYYLADYKNRIAVGNYADFFVYQSLNPLVSEDPSNLKNWHFSSMKSDDGDKYFCDPNYVISSYDAFRKAFGCFQDRYGFNSVDKTGMPLLLCVYEYDESGYYPTAVNEFDINATNCGQIRDWNVTTTSPNATIAVEIGTLTHEFTHGINGQMTNSQYQNQQGAVMEGYADSIGELIAYIYGYKDEEYKWLVGSQFADPFRSFEDPTEYRGAKYIGGQYYVSPVYSYAVGGDLDYGGVHTNSGVVNYLCYEFSNSEKVDKKALLSLEENLDVWFETLYLTTYDSDFEDLAHFLIFAAENIPEISEQKKNTVEKLTKLYGFTGESEELKKLIAAEGGYDYKLSFTFEDEDIPSVFSFGADIVTDNDNEYYSAGEIDEDGYVKVRTKNKIDDAQWEIIIGDNEYFDKIGMVYYLPPESGEELEIYTFWDEASIGDIFDTDGGMIYSVCIFDEDGIDYIDCSGDEAFVFGYEGLYSISYVDENDDAYLAIINVEMPTNTKEKKEF